MQVCNEQTQSKEKVTIQRLAEYLTKKILLKYNNYEYYRSQINDTANRDILKCYSEGLITTDEKGYVWPNKELTRKEVNEIVARIKSPIEVTRPQYLARVNIPIIMYHEINTLPKKGSSGLYVSQENFLKQLEALQKEGYNTITHIDARYTTNIKVTEEYKQSQKVLEGIIGEKVRHFCYPIGGTTPHAISTLKELGYVTAAKTTYGKANKNQGLLQLKRIRADYYDSTKDFLNKIK